MSEYLFIPMGVAILFFVCWLGTVIVAYLVGKRHGKEEILYEAEESESG